MRAALLLLLALLASPTAARDFGQYDKVPAETRQWFRGLTNQLGEVCCDEADGRRVDDPDWGVNGKGYWVAVNGHPQDVPPELIVRGQNRMGYAVAWFYPPSAPKLRCFMPGATG